MSLLKRVSAILVICLYVLPVFSNSSELLEKELLFRAGDLEIYLASGQICEKINSAKEDLLYAIEKYKRGPTNWHLTSLSKTQKRIETVLKQANAVLKKCEQDNTASVVVINDNHDAAISEVRYDSIQNMPSECLGLEIDYHSMPSDYNPDLIFRTIVRDTAWHSSYEDSAHQSLYKKYFECLTRVLRDGADANQGISGANQTAMLWTAYYDSIEVAKLLLSHGADIDLGYTDENTYSPLGLAAYWGHYEISGFYLKNGADVNGGMSSPLEQASRNIKVEPRGDTLKVVDLLFKYNAKLSSQNRQKIFKNLLWEISDYDSSWEYDKYLPISLEFLKKLSRQDRKVIELWNSNVIDYYRLSEDLKERLKL